jgi:chromosome partitioning protein
LRVLASEGRFIDNGTVSDSESNRSRADDIFQKLRSAGSEEPPEPPAPAGGDDTVAQAEEQAGGAVGETNQPDVILSGDDATVSPSESSRPVRSASGTFFFTPSPTAPTPVVATAPLLTDATNTDAADTDFANTGATDPVTARPAASAQPPDPSFPAPPPTLRALDPATALHDPETAVPDPGTAIPDLETALPDPAATPAATPAPSRVSLVHLANLPDYATPSPSDPGRRVHPGSLHPLPRTFAVANQKGGVGKTTTAVNLSAALAEVGYRVLVVDLDPQGNATTGLGINGRNLEHSVYDALLHDVPLEDVIEATAVRNLFVVPATIDLAGAEIELVPVFSRELRLRRALESVHDDFDFILIDCPPSLGLLTVNGLAAANEVVVPIQCEYYALEGLGQLLRNVNLVQSNLNAGLEVSTIIMTMYDARTKLAEQVVTEVRDHFGDRVCRNVVPRTVRLSEAPSFGQPIIVFDPSSRGAIAYRELAKEVSGGAPQRVG